MNLIQLPLALAGSDVRSFLALRAADLLPAGAIALTGLSSHLCLAQAFRYGDASLVVPMDFMRVPLIALAGWWLYGERLDALVFLGAGLIVSGILWNLRTESTRHASVAK
jgi:drug/metabolite transporter (DMT)-like permease